MSSAPTDRLYSETHEWHKLDGDTLTIGLTRFAVDQLTDVTFAEMKPKGTSLKEGDIVGEVESVKTTSDVYAACSGEIIEVNEKLVNDPAILNTDPYGDGWLVKIKVSEKGGLDRLMKHDEYEKQIGA